MKEEDLSTKDTKDNTKEDKNIFEDE